MILNVKLLLRFHKFVPNVNISEIRCYTLEPTIYMEHKIAAYMRYNGRILHTLIHNII